MGGPGGSCDPRASPPAPTRMFLEWLLEYGLWSLAFLMLIQNLIPLIPSEVIMPLAGFLASLGYLDLRAAILVGIAGSLAGHLPWYALGRVAGEERLLAFASRHGPWFGLSAPLARRSADWFHGHAARAVLFGRLIPGIRSFVNIPAGAARMPIAPFLFYTALGEAAWTAALAWGGWNLGHDYPRLTWYLHALGLSVLLLLLAALAWALRKRGGPDAPGPPPRPAHGRPFLRGPAFLRRPWRLRFPSIPRGA